MKCLLLLLSLFFLLNSCVLDECRGREDQSLDPIAVESIPYDEDLNYHFITSSGDEFSTTVEKIEETIVPDIPLVCEGYLEFRISKPGGELFLEILMRGSSQANMVQVAIFDTDGHNGIISQYEVDQDGNLSGVLPHDTFTFHESIEMDGRIYADVIELNYPDFENPLDVDRVFYNATQGLIKVVSNDGFFVAAK